MSLHSTTSTLLFHIFTSRISMALLAILLCPVGASATVLDGQTVEYQYLYDTITTLYANADNGNKVVGPGIEVSNISDSRGTMDISDTNLYVDYVDSSSWNAASFNGFRITDILSTIPDFTDVTINPATNLVGFDASRITFDSDHIWVNWESLAFDESTVVSLDITVPEPSTLALGVLGLVAVSAYRLRRRKR